jgi:hypothetical protein
MVSSLREQASFRGDDAPCLVAAALACRVCLSGAVDWSLDVDDFDAVVEVRCRDCDDRRAVSLTSEQALRLALHRERPLDAA